jgi:hypothetical protein
MSVPEFAEFINQSRSTAWALIRSGAVGARKCGRRTVVLTLDALAYLEQLPRKEAVSQPHRERALRRWAQKGNADNAAQE